MITRSSFLPVCGVIDWLRSTSLSRFRPSGVNSKAQAKISTGSRPMASTTMTMRTAVAPRPNAGNTVWATWINSHATARYAAPTRSTLRRLSSPMKDVVIAIDRVFKLFRTGFLGKVGPVHLFWGSFDLAVTRFDRSDGCSGRHEGPHSRQLRNGYGGRSTSAGTGCLGLAQSPMRSCRGRDGLT